MTNTLGNVWNYAYDSNNFQTSVTDPLGHSTRFRYDPNGNLLAVTNALGQQTVRMSYTTNSPPFSGGGLLNSVADGRGNITAFDYNTEGLVTNVTDALTNAWSRDYDVSGNMTRATDPLGHAVAIAYNGFNKPASITNAVGNVTRFAYDEMANVTNVTDALNHSASFAYDQLQRVTTVRNALGHETRFSYDPESNLTTLSNAIGRAYSFAYDPVNRAQTFTCPNGSRTTAVYDPNGNVTAVTNRNGQVVSAAYDAGNRMTSRAYNGPTNTVFGLTYDHADRLAALTRTSGSIVESAVTNIFDAANRLTATIQSSPLSPQPATVAYSYDSNSSVTNISYPSGLKIGYQLDPLNRISAISSPSTSHQPPATPQVPLASYEYDDAGRLTRRVLDNGTECLYAYDDANRVASIILRTISPQTVIQSFAYGYNAAGMRAWVRCKNGRGDVYQYDETYQVTGVKYNVDDPTVSYASATHPNRTVTYSYDAVGNRTTVTDNLNTTSYTVNELDQYTQTAHGSQITAYSYDANGNLAGDGAWAFEYDHDNRLIGAARNGLSVRYGYDGHGNVRFLTDQTGAVTDTCDYDAFGILIHQTGSTPNNYLYAGEQNDPALGLYYNRARYLNVGTGRFHTMDPAQGFQRTPLSLHKYLYAHANAVNLIDPRGLLVKHAVRDLAGFLWGSHQFLILIPDNPDDLVGGSASSLLGILGTTLTDIGGQKVIVVGAHNINKRLTVKFFEESDVFATRELIDKTYDPPWYTIDQYTDFDAEAGDIAPPAGKTDTQFILDILNATKNFFVNEGIRNIPYPKFGIGNFKGYNSNSWATSVIRYAGGTPHENFRGSIDPLSEARIPDAYFIQGGFQPYTATPAVRSRSWIPNTPLILPTPVTPYGF